MESSAGNRKKAADEKSELIPNWRVDSLFPQLSAEIRAKLKEYHAEMIKFNNSINLISAKTIPHADVIHFSDAILASQLIYKNIKDEHIYDIGSGNGIPGIAYSILFPKAKVTLIEQDQRKAEFLKHCVNKLALSNTDVLNIAVEKLPAASVKCAMSRGFASISKSMLATRRVFAKNGIYFHLKSEEWASEIADIPTQLCSFWQPSLLSEYKLPVGEVKFAIVKTVKVAD